ncbi:hypothetical protein Hanom_Chr07g00585751 [Helianthus anomalus]
MALTWATGVRFGRMTRRNERENELHLAANSLRLFGSSPCVWPVIFLRPISNLCPYLYVPLVMETIRIEF